MFKLAEVISGINIIPNFNPESLEEITRSSDATILVRDSILSFKSLLDELEALTAEETEVLSDPLYDPLTAIMTTVMIEAYESVRFKLVDKGFLLDDSLTHDGSVEKPLSYRLDVVANIRLEINSKLTVFKNKLATLETDLEYCRTIYNNRKELDDLVAFVDIPDLLAEDKLLAKEKFTDLNTLMLSIAGNHSKETIVEEIEPLRLSLAKEVEELEAALENVEEIEPVDGISGDMADRKVEFDIFYTKITSLASGKIDKWLTDLLLTEAFDVYDSSRNIVI